MQTFNIKDRVYAINKNQHQIECGIIRKIIIEEKKTSFDLELLGYNTFTTMIVEESMISKNVDDLYQRIKNSIEKFFPLMWR